MSVPPVAFTIPEPPPVGGTQQFVLGDGRWLWWWTPVDRFSTVSAQDGSDFQMFAKAVGSVMEYAGPTTTGPLFLAEEFDQLDGGHVQGIIAYSDGVSPMKPYLVPPDPDNDYGEPVFANSNVAFMKGIHQTGVNQYDSVEIWTTPYSTDPTQLKPRKVAALPFQDMPPVLGGWGRVATSTLMGGDAGIGLGIWTLSSGLLKAYAVPGDYFFNTLLGLTRSHVWLGAAKPMASDDNYLFRLDVQ